MGFDRDGIAAFAAKLQTALESFFPGVLEMDGEEFGVACSGGDKTGGLESGGMLEEMGQLVRLDKSVHPEKPKLGARVSLNGVSGRIVSVGVREYSGAWSLRINLAR